MSNATYIGNNRILCRVNYGNNLLLPSNDLSITPEIIMNGSMELPLTQYFQHHVSPGNRILDIGANLGYFSVLLGALIGPSGRLWAYEPHPRLHGLLLDNLSINYLRDRVTPIAKAAYSKPGELNFHSSQRFMGNSSIHAPSAFYEHHYTDEFIEIAVPTERLDDRAEEFGMLDFIKIDIEGGEYHAFLGMEKLISTQTRRVVFELNRPMLGEDWEPFCNLLKRFRDDYSKQFYLITGNGELVWIELSELIAIQGYPYVLMQGKQDI